jgi:hypothetical protein
MPSGCLREVVEVSLPNEVSSHHTVWVTPSGRRPVAVRYASVDGHLYCFGDDGLADVHDGERVHAAIHRIAGGPPIAEFAATTRRVPGTAVDREALVQLLEHVPLGRTRDEVEEGLERHRHRPVVELLA